MRVKQARGKRGKMKIESNEAERLKEQKDRKR